METAQQASSTPSNPYRMLSPGNRSIARALYDAQQAEDGGPAWTLDRIAAAKQNATGWNAVFRVMKDDGLLRQKRMSQVITASIRKSGNAGRTASAHTDRPYRSDVVVTTADGRRVVVGLLRPIRKAQPVVQAVVTQTRPKLVKIIETAALDKEILKPVQPRRRVTYRWVTGQLTTPFGATTQASAAVGTTAMPGGHTTGMVRANGGRLSSIAHRASR
ncbi:MAG: hypothetical protein H8E39_01065 [Alphaproteobacteria bacterium]|nr:hypothetical protein [Alphaproteobacteria bacterium]